MPQSFPVAGRKIYMCGVIDAPASGELFVAGDFPDLAAADWIPIGKWQTAGTVGGDQATMTSSYINEEFDDVQMGTKNPGTMSNTYGVVPDDPGQIALYAAAGDKKLRGFLIEFPDAPSGATSHGTIRLFAAYVKEPIEQGGEANTMGMVACDLIRFKNTVRVEAAADGGPVASDTGA